ncbi:MAG: hypothetical protein AABY32_05900 [Nanoarchaeota archaeon]
MPLILHTSNDKFKGIIIKKFDLLLNLFKFNPNTISPYKIEVTIIDSTEEFLTIYEREYNIKPQKYVVGFAATNGRVFILNENLFEAR